MELIHQIEEWQRKAELDSLRQQLAERGGIVEQIARMAHEANRAYCQALGDDSQPAWEDAPEWQALFDSAAAMHGSLIGAVPVVAAKGD